MLRPAHRAMPACHQRPGKTTAAGTGATQQSAIRRVPTPSPPPIDRGLQKPRSSRPASASASQEAGRGPFFQRVLEVTCCAPAVGASSSSSRQGARPIRQYLFSKARRPATHSGTPRRGCERVTPIHRQSRVPTCTYGGHERVQGDRLCRAGSRCRSKPSAQPAVSLRGHGN